jgi:hypothetical protein
MKNWIKQTLLVCNGLTPFIVVLFIYVANNNYVNKEEYERTKDQIFKQLDHVEKLINRISLKTNETSNNF